MKNSVTKIIGLVAPVVGLIATLMTDWAHDKELEETVELKVHEALAKQNGEEP